MHYYHHTQLTVNHKTFTSLIATCFDAKAQYHHQANLGVQCANIFQKVRSNGSTCVVNRPIHCTKF
jgi:hypothetical protein